LIINIIQNILFLVQQKKETHKGLEQHKGEYMMTEFSFFFWVNYPFKDLLTIVFTIKILVFSLIRN